MKYPKRSQYEYAKSRYRIRNWAEYGRKGSPSRARDVREVYFSTRSISSGESRDMRYFSKQGLLDTIRREHDALCTSLQGIPESRFDDPGVWGDGWTIKDLVAHLAEWHSMFLRWFGDGQEGKYPLMPAPGFKWNETPRLNRAIWEKHHGRSFADVWGEFTSTYERILKLVEELPEDRLLKAGHFHWTGKHPLSTYLGPNTASHYRFASKVLKRWLRTQPLAPGESGTP